MRVKAYAKVNLTLEVLGRPPGLRGYHQVLTVLQTIDLADELIFEPSSSLSMECSVTELETEDNLVWKAARALQQASGSSPGARIELEKRIPIAMGLGGGSSDAAATLVSLNRLWGLGLDRKALLEIGRTLGADVPFFLGGGTALGQGRGDEIETLPSIGQRWLVVLCPTISLPRKTAYLYSLLTPDCYTDGSSTGLLVDALKEGRFSDELLFNVFERIALDAFPGLDRVLEDFLRVAESGVYLSGTGPALYTLASSREAGEKIVVALRTKDVAAYLVSTVETYGP